MDRRPGRPRYAVRGVETDPPGTVDEEASAWLLAALSCGRSKTALAIAREVVREAYDVDDALLGFGTSSPASRAIPPDRVYRTRPIRSQGRRLTAKAPPARVSGACAIIE